MAMTIRKRYVVRAIGELRFLLDQEQEGLSNRASRYKLDTF